MQALILLSNILNVMMGGSRLEPLSSRCYREGRNLPVRIIDGIFFFEKDHCKVAYENNIELMKEFLKGNK